MNEQRPHEAGVDEFSDGAGTPFRKGYCWTTLTALGPFGPSSESYDTRAPSARERKPLPWIAEWCTKRSLPPSSGVMKPKPLSLLNHLTVPVAMDPPRSCAALRRRPESYDCAAALLVWCRTPVRWRDLYHRTGRLQKGFQPGFHRDLGDGSRTPPAVGEADGSDGLRLPPALHRRQPLLRLDRGPRPAARSPRRRPWRPLHAQSPPGRPG